MWTLDWMTGHQVDLTADLRLRYEREAREAWGGERHYVAKEMARQPHVRERILVDVSNGALSDTEIQRRHGISRTTLYRLIKRGP